MGPAVQSLAPNLVPVEDLPNAIAWNSSSWQMASILGPVAGGLLYGLGASVAYSVAFVLFIVSATLAVAIRKPEQRGPAKPSAWKPCWPGSSSSRRRRSSSARSRSTFSLSCWAVLSR